MRFRALALGFVAILGVATSAFGIELKKGTPVSLTFDQGLSSKTAHVGDKVMFHVADDVTVGGTVVIKRGARASATISEMQKKGRFGKNAQIKLTINPIKVGSVDVPLQPRQKGNIVGGKRGAQAAGVSGAGLVVLGPLGAAAGYGIVGHEVDIKAGGKLETQVSADVQIGR